MTGPLRIALAQLERRSDVGGAARVAMIDAMRRAAAAGAHMLVLPEMFAIGYTPALTADDQVLVHPDEEPGPERPDVAGVWAGRAEPVDGPFVTVARRAAAELGIAVVATFLEEHDPCPRNTAVVIDAQGELVLHYAKVHTSGFALPEAALSPGDEFGVADLPTAAGVVRIGAMICFDREFPEAARELMLAGAELIVVPNACDWDPFRRAQLVSRAGENMLAIAMANYAGAGWGGSCLLDGRPFGSDGYREMTVVRAGEDADVLCGELDLAALREYRRREVWGDSFRRPSAYRLADGRSDDPVFRRVPRSARPS